MMKGTLHNVGMWEPASCFPGVAENGSCKGMHSYFPSAINSILGALGKPLSQPLATICNIWIMTLCFLQGCKNCRDNMWEPF